jgi:chemotaxis-related protein WspD
MNAVLKDCWNVIGVRGDASCGELTTHLHCRNCPVYSSAAGNLLDREPPADYVRHWTEQARQSRGEAERAALSALLFRIGAEWLALPTSVVAEIASLRPIHSLPHRRNGVVLGVANIRGTLVVAVSLRDLIGIDATPDKRVDKVGALAGRLLVMQRDGARVVCPVDEIHGIERFFTRDLGAVPSTVAGATSRHTRWIVSWQKRSVGLLDEQAILTAAQRSLA